jgi:hypothetical protein
MSYQVTRASVAVIPKGNAAEQVAVEAATVPAKPGQLIVWSVPVSETRLILATVPSGTFEAAITTLTAFAALIVTSGATKLPVGAVGAATPFTLTIRIAGAVVGKGSATGLPTTALGWLVPLKLLLPASIRTRPGDP